MLAIADKFGKARASVRGNSQRCRAVQTFEIKDFACTRKRQLLKAILCNRLGGKPLEESHRIRRRPAAMAGQAAAGTPSMLPKSFRSNSSTALTAGSSTALTAGILRNLIHSMEWLTAPES
jgi:hypothetical protein